MEIILLILLVTLHIQSSSLISSLLIVPSSVLLMVVINFNFVYSGLLCYIFIMIFIGGLMVLLVSVSSSTQQEQGMFPSIVLMFLLFLYTGLLLFMGLDWVMGSDFSETSSNLLSFMNFTKLGISLSLLTILIICLFILTKLLMDYKGLTRNL